MAYPSMGDPNRERITNAIKMAFMANENATNALSKTNELEDETRDIRLAMRNAIITCWGVLVIQMVVMACLVVLWRRG